MIDYKLDNTNSVVFNAISSVNKVAYNSISLICSWALSKNPFCGKILPDYQNERDITKINKLFVIRQIFNFYKIYFAEYLKYLRTYLKHSKKASFCDASVVIDTFFMVDEILEQGFFKEKYLCNIDDDLDKIGIEYYYFPFLYCGDLDTKLAKLTNLLNNQKVKYIIEFDLLNIYDFVKILFHIVHYPLSVIYNVAQIKPDSRINRLIRFKMISMMHADSFLPYARYLAGKRLPDKLFKLNTLILWYENQPKDKYLIKAIKDTKKDIKIFGLQSFLYNRDFLSILVDENEYDFGLTPDVVFVNGATYLPLAASNVEFKIGFSFRYHYIDGFISNSKSLVVVAMSSFDEYNRYLLQIVEQVSDSRFEIVIKFHQDNNIANYYTRHKTTTLNMQYLLQDAFCVIGGKTGTIVESLACGIPAIELQKNGDTYYKTMLNENYMLDNMYNIVSDVEQLCSILHVLHNAYPDESAQKKCVDYFKSKYFSFNKANFYSELIDG